MVLNVNSRRVRKGEQTRERLLGAAVAEFKREGLAGADIATMPFKVLEQLFKHPLTDKGLKAFLDDWATIDASMRPF